MRDKMRDISIRGPSTCYFPDQSVDLGLPLFQLLLRTTAESEVLQVIITSPPYSKRVWIDGRGTLKRTSVGKSRNTMFAYAPMEFLGELGTAWVTLFKNMRPFRRSGVSFFLFGTPGTDATEGVGCFFRIELFLPPLLPLGGGCSASLQHRMIFSNRKTWYSRSTSDFVTVKISSSSKLPKLDK